MANFNLFLSILAISQLIFLGSYTYANFRRHRVARLILAFTICLISFLLSGIPFINASALTNLVLSSLAILTPAALWVFAVSLFRDEKEIPSYGLGLILVYFILRTLNVSLDYLGYDPGQFGYYLGYIVPLIIMLGLSIHVIYMGIEGRKADLVEERRRIRIPFVIIMGVVVVFTLLFGALSTSMNLPSSSISVPLFFEAVSLIIVAAVFFWALVLNLALFKLRDEAQLLLQNAPRIDLDQAYGESPFQAEQEVKKLSKEEKLVGRIKQAMDEQMLFKETSFTITKLAATLSVPEQRLRTTINKKLGFRNFNQFLNYYRIKEATQQLSISEEPIAKIAMEVGYNSLSSFNKSFKESHGMPPREYRTVAEDSR